MRFQSSISLSMWVSTSSNGKRRKLEIVNVLYSNVCRTSNDGSGYSETRYESIGADSFCCIIVIEGGWGSGKREFRDSVCFLQTDSLLLYVSRSIRELAELDTGCRITANFQSFHGSPQSCGCDWFWERVRRVSRPRRQGLHHRQWGVATLGCYPEAQLRLREGSRGG